MYVSVNIIRHVFNRFSWRASVKTYSDLKYALGNLFLFLCLLPSVPYTRKHVHRLVQTVPSYQVPGDIVFSDVSVVRL